ncbi:MAG: filamentous hemagglutinin N-terminal domain-containing protein, partial [Planctomycetales bacterium]|nr:filamentous hemagglutinin N-terminal domain-containing protein [Planctomycetales bacterium]
MKTLKHLPYARIAHKLTACLLIFCIVNLPAWALDAEDASMSAVSPGGSVNITGGANTVSVDLINANRAVLDWTQMNATSAETLNFIGAGGFAVLNRVASGVNFDGALNGAGGHVFVISPNGVVIGPNASITASAFTAAGLNITNQNFMNGIYQFVPFAGGVVSDVTNYAVIDGVTDQVNLLGKTVLNEGTISLPVGGVVVMAAGDSVYLGEPGGNIIVEMTSVKDGTGKVENAGSITSPGGEVVLAAGDIFAAALEDGHAMKVHWGEGTVEQNGLINVSAATGDGGTVSLTAGDTTTLGANSKTYANAGTDGDSGLVSAHSLGITDVMSGAEIQAMGGYWPGEPEGETSLFPVQIVLENSVQIIGDTIRFDGTIDATASEIGKKGKIWIEADNLTIADVLPANPNPIDNIIVEEFIESQSKAAVDIELAVHSSSNGTINVGPLGDGEILGGSGDIVLRTLYGTGEIIFLPDSDGEYASIHTVANKNFGVGGNIFLTAGAGGIIAGDLITGTLSNDPISNPGRIRLLTAGGGDIRVGEMFADRGNISEISVISSGSLSVYGSVISMNATVPKEDKDVGFARICLAAMDDIYVNGDGGIDRGTISVNSHGKYATASNIIICAGGDINIENLGNGINATAKTSENTQDSKSLSVVGVNISAGGNKEEQASITINGTTYDDMGDNADLPIYLEAKASGSGQDVTVAPDETPEAGEPGELIWQETKTDPEPVDEYLLGARLRINDNELIIPGEEGSPCAECPIPPGSFIKIVARDDFAVAHMNTQDISALIGGQTDLLWNDQGEDLTLIYYSQAKDPATGQVLGNLTLTTDETTGQLIVNFDYDPADGFADVVEFEYAIYDTKTQRVATATVQITLTNTLPTFNGDLGDVHMNTPVTGIDLLSYANDVD